MFPLRLAAARLDSTRLITRSLAFFALALWLAPPPGARAQGVQRELDTPEKVSIAIANRNGRVSVITGDEQKKVVVNATSTGAPVEPGDVLTSLKGGNLDIDVRARSEQNRIDLTVRVPPRSRITISSDAGAVDVVGNVEFAEVQTNTGTIHADVPLDKLNFNFLWHASRPRFLSAVALPEVKEKAGGSFTISGSLDGDQLSKKKAKQAKKPKKQKEERASDQVASLQPAGDQTAT